MAFLATAPLVLVKDQLGRIHYHYESVNPVIPWLSDEQAEHFLTQGIVTELDDESAAAVEPTFDPSDKPAHAALKASWVDYAVAQGAVREEADAMSKADLVELYG